MRGELCPFDHGKDPVVLEDISVSPRGTTGEFIGVPGANNVYAPQILRPAMPLIGIYVRFTFCSQIKSLGIGSVLIDISYFFVGAPAMEPPLCWGGVPPPFRPRHMGKFVIK